MLPIGFRVEYIGTFETMPKRRLYQGLKQVNLKTGEHYDDKILPKSFAADAWARRNYRKRTHATRMRKERLGQLGKAKYDGKRDLVETGLLEEAVKIRHRVTANKNQSTTHIPGPVYFREQIADEVLRFIPSDSEEIRTIANDELGEFIKTSNHRTRFRTKG